MMEVPFWAAPSQLFSASPQLQAAVETILHTVRSLSRVRLFATPWTVACRAPLSVGFSRQGYRSGLPFPSPGNYPYPGIESVSPMSSALRVGSLPI